MLCQFLLYNKLNQLYVYIYPHIPSLLHLPPTLPILPPQMVTKHRADLPVLCSCFSLAIYFTFGSVYMSTLLFHFIPASPPPPRVLKSVLYVCVFIPVLLLFFFFLIFGCTGSSLLCAGFLQLQRAGATLCCGARASHCSGFSCCGARALSAGASGVVARGLQSAGSVAVAQGLSCSTACGIFPDQGWNPCPSHWQADS